VGEIFEKLIQGWRRYTTTRRGKRKVQRCLEKGRFAKCLERKKDRFNTYEEELGRRNIFVSSHNRICVHVSSKHCFFFFQNGRGKEKNNIMKQHILKEGEAAHSNLIHRNRLSLHRCLILNLQTSRQQQPKILLLLVLLLPLLRLLRQRPHQRLHQQGQQLRHQIPRL